MRFGSLKRESILVPWIFSYISVLLIPVIISIAVYYSTYRIVENEINTTNAALLKQVQQTFDEKLADVEKLCLQINFNIRVQSMYLSAGNPLSASLNYKMYEINKDFKSYKSSMRFVEDFYVYFGKIDKVITPETVCDSKLFYNNFYSTDDMSYEQWYKMINKKYYQNFITMNKKSSGGKMIRTLGFVQSLPMKIKDSYDSTLIIVLDEQYFIEAIKKMEWLNKGQMYILNSNNEVLVSTNATKMQSPVKYNNLNKPGEILTGRYNDEDVVITYISSNVSELKYVSVLPSMVFKQKGQHVQRITIFSVLLCLVLGGIISYYFVKRNYVPVKELVQTIANKVAVTKDKKLNEYKFLHYAISSAFNEKEKSDEWINLQKKSIRSNLLTKLLVGQWREYTNLDEALERFDIQFGSDYFGVMQFYIENYSKLDAESDPEENIKLAKSIIYNVVEELAAQKHKGFMTEANNVLSCIISFNGPIPEDGGREMFEIACKARDFIREKFRIVFSVSISNVHRTIDGIAQAHKEAIEAIEYKIITGKGSIISFNELIKTDTCYEYHEETERQLVNNVKIGDFDNAKIILQGILKDNLSGRELTAKMAKCMVFDLISTIVKVSNEFSNGNSEALSGNIKPVDLLFSCETIEDMEYHLTSILKSVCDYVQKKKKSHNNKLKDDIIKEAEATYQDINLSVSSIAEKFALAPNYLSSFFREQTGYGLSDFINKIRIEKSKELLRQQKRKISDVARTVGFYDSNSFIRSFKKHEGITPGMYKDMDETMEN